MRVMAIALVCLTLAPSAPAQEPASPGPEALESETRVEEWTRRRSAQEDRLEPYRAGLIERSLLAIEKAERPTVLELNYRGFYPRIQGIASGSRNALGVRFWQPDLDGTRLSVHGSAFYSWNRYQFYDLQVGRIPHRRHAFPPRSVKGDDIYELGQLGRPGASRLILYGSLRYDESTQMSFFGLGPDSQREAESSYRLRDSSFELVTGYQLGRRFAALLRPGYLTSTALPGTREDVPSTGQVFDEATAPGLTRPLDYWYLTGQLFFDGRDAPGNPRRGGMVALQYSEYEDRHGDGFAFARLGVDARAYVPLGSPQRVLALRGYFANENARNGGQVPFYRQEFLGGSHTLRGYADFRFRGTDLLLLQAEYRWEPTPAVELALFVDAGQVASDPSQLDLSGLPRDFGFGIRGKSFKAVLMRLDVAWSEEGTRVYLRFSQGF